MVGNTSIIIVQGNKKLKLSGLTYDYTQDKPLHFLIQWLIRECPEYNCRHCLTKEPDSEKARLRKSALENYFKIPKGNKLAFEQREAFTKETADLGARVAIFLGYGETTIHPDLERILALHKSLGMETILFTKGYTLNEEKAKLYKKTDTRIMVSVDTLDNNLYKELTGSRFSITGILKNILAAKEIMYDGYTKDTNAVPIAFNTIICQKNKEEIPKILEFCAENEIASYITPPLDITGRLLDRRLQKEYAGTKKEEIGLMNYIYKLSVVSNLKFYKDENGCCRQPTDALVIDEMGRILPCMNSSPDAFYLPLGVYPEINIKEAVRRRDEYREFFYRGQQLKCIKHNMPENIFLQYAASNLLVASRYYDGNLTQGTYKNTILREISQLIKTKTN